MTNFNEWKEKATFLRKLILTSTTEAGSGHVTSSLSSVDLMTVLFDAYFSYDLDNPSSTGNDRLVFSKGHASPLYYSLFAMSGGIPLEELKSLRKFRSNLEGHPTRHFPYSDAATGSLGQGLSVAAGLSIGLKKFHLQTIPFIYVLLGDGELAEGQVWEAANFSSYYQLHNIVAIVDINRLGQSQETMLGHDIIEYEKRFQSFGFDTYSINGHDFSEITNVFHGIRESKSSKPKVILAKTIKGKGVSFLENKDNWHGKALTRDQLHDALVELGGDDKLYSFNLKKPMTADVERKIFVNPPSAISYAKNIEVATREAVGSSLLEKVQANNSIIVLDGDVNNSTYTSLIKNNNREQFIQCFIAEQNMVSVAIGLSRLSYHPVVATFAAFLTRAADQIRMAALSHASILFVGTHVGVEIGEDGPSQMGLEDISLFGTIPESIIMQPSDAVAGNAITSLLCNSRGIRYIRALRSKTPILYENSESFQVGGSKVIKSNPDDHLVIAATGIAVHEALKAYYNLEKEGIHVKVVDCYSIKPFDDGTLKKLSSQTIKNVIVTVEDHFDHGGFGDFVLNAFTGSETKIVKLSLNHISRSGSSQELLADAKIDSASIVAKIKENI